MLLGVVSGFIWIIVKSVWQVIRKSRRCGGRLRLIAAVEDPAVVGTILVPLGLLHPADSPGPAPPSADLRAAAPSHQ